MIITAGCASSTKYSTPKKKTMRWQVGNEYILESDVGTASFYGKEFAGKPTASGEIFDPSAITAAHREYSFGTMVRVINLKNRKSVVVRINDRGPFIKGRIIDLSSGAAAKIGMLQDGIARVRLEVLEWGGE